MDYFTLRQIIMFLCALLVAGLLVSAGTIYVLERLVLYDPSDPLSRQGGLSPSQEIHRK